MHFLPSCFVLPAAFILDLLLGDPPSLPHPVRWMGKAIELFEPLFRKIPGSRKFAGTLFCAFLFATTGILALGLLYLAQWVHPWLKISLEVILIYFCISVRSLEDAAMEIHGYLLQLDLEWSQERIENIQVEAVRLPDNRPEFRLH